MHLINVATFNSHILHKKKGGRLNPLEFRKKLVISLFEKYSNCSTTATAQEDEKVMKIILCDLQKGISQSTYLPLKKRKMLPEDVLYVANMTSVEKQNITVLNVKLLYVRHHVSVITTPRKNSETVFLHFL